MSVDTMLVVELMEWIEEREDSSAWELAEALVETGWVAKRDAEVAAKAWDRGCASGYREAHTNVTERNPYQKAVQS